MLDAMSYLIYNLQERFALLGEETMLSAVAKMMAFHMNRANQLIVS